MHRRCVSFLLSAVLEHATCTCTADTRQRACTSSPPPSGGRLRRARATTSQSGAHLQAFDAKQVLATLAASLQPRIRSSLASNAFSGISIRGALLLRQLPCTPQSFEDPQALAGRCQAVRQLTLLLHAAAVSAADAMSFRPPQLAEVLAAFGMRPSWAAPADVIEHGVVFPSWHLVVDVRLRCPVF